MGFLDRLKNVVTGGAAKVELSELEGAVEPESMLRVKVVVTAEAELKSKGVFVDLHGEDDLDENLLQKAAEIFSPDPEFSYPLGEGFTLAKGESKTFANYIVLPKELPANRTWLFRARVEAPGKDPASAWQAGPVIVVKAEKAESEAAPAAEKAEAVGTEAPAPAAEAPESKG